MVQHPLQRLRRTIPMVTQVRTQARPHLNMENAVSPVRAATQDPDPVACCDLARSIQV